MSEPVQQPDPQGGETSNAGLEGWLAQQTVCVTGGRGWLGRSLVDRLVSGGARRVITLNRQPPANPSDPQTASDGRVAHLTGDIMNPDDLGRALSGCTLVFHLAALARVGDSLVAPLSHFEVNTLGTARLLEVCRQQGITRVVYASTGHVYGVPQQLPVGEEHPTNPLSPYAASKLAAEVVVRSYTNSFGFSSDIARVGNLYGKSTSPETVVERILDRVRQGGPLRLFNLSTARDFIHVTDAAEALVRLAAAGDGASGCRALNVSSGRACSLGEVVETLSRVAMEEGREQPIEVQEGEPQPEPVPRLALDNRKLIAATGWQPRISLDEGLRLAWRDLVQRESPAG